MIGELPWEIQKYILSFDIKHDLHSELKKKVKIINDIKSENIEDKKFKLFLMDCVYLNNTNFYNNIKWYNWILQKIYNGERVWIHISQEHQQLILFLKKCNKLRFSNQKNMDILFFRGLITM